MGIVRPSKGRRTSLPGLTRLVMEEGRRSVGRLLL
jgi:hypothetical protein